MLLVRIETDDRDEIARTLTELARYVREGGDLSFVPLQSVSGARMGRAATA